MCLLLFKLADEKSIDLNNKVLVTKEDITSGSGAIKDQKEAKEYTIEKLIELCIIESDNTAYIELMNLIGKERVIEFGKSLGAIHTLEGKDLYGITNCLHMIKYWKEIIKYIEKNNNGSKFKNYLLNPSVKLIKNDNYIRKYGLCDLAYHEVGYVYSDKPYYLIILTQPNKKEYKEEYINRIASLLNEINDAIK